MPASFFIAFAVFSVKVIIVLVYLIPPLLKFNLAIYTACVH